MKKTATKVMIAGALALGLTGCFATGEIKNTDHRGVVSYTWTGTEEAIYEKAAEACPRGYDVVTEMGQMLPTIRTITVNCK